MTIELSAVWVRDKARDVMLEIAAPKKAQYDETQSKALYEATSVRKYWLHDPLGGYTQPVMRDSN